MSFDDDLISREEVLAGLPARRANTLLFLIESRTAQIVARSLVEFSLTEQAASERDLAFLEAFALGNAPPLHPTIQHLERYASQWASLVPSNPKLKAAIAHAIGQKYTFTYQAVPNLRATLGWEEKVVQVAYSRLYRKQLLTIFASTMPLIEQWRWMTAALAQRLESLPPFWLASILTVALGLPQAFLALPIAVADVGPLATVAFVVIIGTINILTMACMAEAIGRSGDFRYGNSFIKQLVSNYLGNTGSFILSIAVGIRVFLIALACYIGLSVTMASFTHISAALWAVLLFGAGLYLRSRKSLNFTVALMVLLAVVNVSLLLILSLLALRHVQLSNLLYVNLPFLNGHPFQPWMLQRILGVSLMLYFGHIYVGECGKLILPRDPSATSLIWGSIAGTAFLTVLFCIWVLAVNGAISPQLLAKQSGTALEPLAAQVGSIVTVLGAVLVTLLLGMAWLRSSSLLINLTKEWFPARPRSILRLPRHSGILILRSVGDASRVPHIGLTYLGLEEQAPKFRLDIQFSGKVHHVEITFTERWEIKELLSQFPDLGKWDTRLTIKVQSANQDSVCVQIISPMLLVYGGGLKADVSNTTSEHQSQAARFWTTLLARRRFFLSISPLLLVFLLTEWLFLAGTQSFTSVLAFAGVLGNSLVGGIFPVLLLVSSRRKGELVPGVVFKILNRPLFSVGIYSIFLAILLVHGLFIWENSVARISVQYDWLLTLIVVSFAAVNVLTLQLISRQRVDANRRLIQEYGKAAGVSIAALQSIETLKASGLESEFFSRWSGHYTKALNSQQELGVTNQIFSVLPSLLSALSSMFLLVVGGLRVMDGHLSIGMLIAFQGLMLNFQQPVNNLVNFGTTLQELEGNLIRLDDVLDNPVNALVEQSKPSAGKREDLSCRQKCARLQGYVELQNITFGYSRLEPPLIENFSLSIKPGQRVALVGGSGSGKSTIAKLVSGLYQPWAGEICFDGKPREQIQKQLLTNSVAMVEQDILLFGGTVRDNLTLWDTTVPDKNLQQACLDAAIADVILSMSGGYDAELIEGAANLSGGQRQRLEIARALVNNPSILVMDEATSALDGETEKIIDQNLRCRGCTCIIVAHRLSTIRDCDQIIVLERGKVVQRGTHQELWQVDGVYSRLIRTEGEAL